ncbi:SDR family oxidoreductase [Denitratisoma sp. DHT3]|uniref:SDR family oxidoreductase n=1 Tax=Denitratisoma sp. DHT3 TaxID=1981880 RepID=UPI0016483F52|nr:SDR family oxidoreductase [Denitratisoma sp. DHT3]
MNDNTMHDNARRVALVSGGGTGIGKAICLRLARDGFAVAVGYARSAEGAEDTVKRIGAAGGEAFAHRADVSQEEEVVAFFAAVKARYGRIDVVINNAGIGHMKPFHDIPMSHYDFTFGLNARGTFMMCREAARHIEDDGRIVSISTGATVANPAAMALYVGSKMAVEGFTKVLARELAPRGITVNAVSPGMTDTPMLEGGDAAALRKYGATAAAMGRLGQPEEVADAVAALVSQDGRWITGQVIHVDGGTIIV